MTLTRNVMLLLLSWMLITAANAQPLVIQGATVIDVTDGSLHSDQTVLIEGNRMAAMGADVAIPAEAEVVDATGGYLIPGLWDMHVHTFNNNDPQPPNTWTFPLYLANGVTGVRDMWVKPGAQAEQVRAWERELDAGTFVGPRFGGIGTLVDGTPRIQKSDTVTTPAEARAFVARLAGAGIDFVKPYSRLSPEAYHALVEAAHEAGLEVAGHGPNALSSFEVATAGQRSIEHLTGVHETCSAQEDSLRAAGVVAYSAPQAVVSTFDPAKCRRLYRTFAERGTWQVPTLITNRIWRATTSLDALRQDEGLLYTPTWEVAEWEWVGGFLTFSSAKDRTAYDDLYRLEQRIVGEMHAAGVPLLAGTDVGNPYVYPGFSLLDELAEFVEAGLSPLAALQTVTRNPARYLDRTDDLGTVEAGKLADLVLLDANPLDDINNLRHIRAVVVNGRFYTHDELEQMKAAVLAKNYREALAQPPPLSAQPLDADALQPFTGRYYRAGRETPGEVTLDSGALRVSFGDWIDPLEPLGGVLFRVPGTNVLYVFHTDADGTVWGFELNDGDNVYTYRRNQEDG